MNITSFDHVIDVSDWKNIFHLSQTSSSEALDILGKLFYKI